MSIHSLSRSNPSTLEDLEWTGDEEDGTLSITDKVGYSILFEADDRLQSLVKQGVWPDIKSVVLSELSNELDHYLLFYCRLKKPHGLNTRAPGSRTIRIIVGIDATDLWILSRIWVQGSLSLSSRPEWSRSSRVASRSNGECLDSLSGGNNTAR